MTSINNPELLQTLSNAAQSFGGARSGIGASANTDNSRPDSAPRAEPPRSGQVSSDDEIRAAADRIAEGNFRREAPLAVSEGPNGVRRDQLPGQILNILV